MTPSKSEGSIKEGIWFVFENDGNKICVWGSSFNGKEIIYLNDQIVSEKRNVKFKGKHQFKDNNGNEFEVEFETVSTLKGELKCDIIKNGNRIKTFTAKYIKPKNKKFNIIFLIFFILLGVIIGIIDIPEKIFIPILLIIAVLLIFLRLKITQKNKRESFLIEEIDN
jgi:hypothetical protein